MASSPQPPDGASAGLPPAMGRPMTRCECSGTSFEEVARQVYLEGRTLDEATRRTGCGRNCGACLPDLQRFLARLRG